MGKLLPGLAGQQLLFEVVRIEPEMVSPPAPGVGEEW